MKESFELRVPIEEILFPADVSAGPQVVAYKGPADCPPWSVDSIDLTCTFGVSETESAARKVIECAVRAGSPAAPAWDAVRLGASAFVGRELDGFVDLVLRGCLIRAPFYPGVHGQVMPSLAFVERVADRVAAWAAGGGK